MVHPGRACGCAFTANDFANPGCGKKQPVPPALVVITLQPIKPLELRILELSGLTQAIHDVLERTLAEYLRAFVPVPCLVGGTAAIQRGLMPAKHRLQVQHLP